MCLHTYSCSVTLTPTITCSLNTLLLTSLASKPLTFQSLNAHVDFPTRFPSNLGNASFLDLCFTSIPDSRCATQLSPLVNSDLAVVSINISFHSPSSQEPPTNKISFGYQCAYRESFRDFLRVFPWNVVFNDPVQKCASEVSSWVKAFEAFIPARKYKVKSRSSPWFSKIEMRFRKRHWLLYQGPQCLIPHQSRYKLPIKPVATFKFRLKIS